MLPEQPISYPEFVADQLLTAGNLNDMFNYLDEQERGTRINLIGIGIVCGLELSVDPAGTSITISRGCGITSAGYLIRWDETKLENYISYDAAKELVYTPQFVTNGKQRFPIDELKSNSSEEGLTKLSAAYLVDKVVLLFVELLEVNSKNCDPESCDDMGKNITLTIRPLIINRKYAALLSGGVAGSSSFSQTWASLPEIFIPRHHLPAADIFTTGDVYEGFQKVLNPTFLQDLERRLGQTYSRISPIIKDLYPANPFIGLANNYAFITNGTMTVAQLLYMQYYYDLFSDVIYAYEELRMLGSELLSLCAPDEALFPRHLLLGLAQNTSESIKSDFRHYFIPSPAVCCHGTLVAELRVLFKRLVLLLAKFNPLNSRQFEFNTNSFTNLASVGRSGLTVPIRITPSKAGDIPLSSKSIPFYYDVTNGTDKLLQYWNYKKSLSGNASKNLSYYGADYANGDDHVANPLHYDLEPYNFLRIEGHVGHGYVEALASINTIKETNRLPFDVVALSADIITLREQLATIATSVSNAGLSDTIQTEMQLMCHFQDLEALYDTLAQGLLCHLCKEMKYYYSAPRATDGQVADLIPTVPLLKKCDPSFRYRTGTLGDLFEQFWQKVASQGYLSPDQLINANFGTATFSNNQRESSIFNLFFALLYYIEKLSEILPTTLIAFNLVGFLRRYNDLITIAQKLKDFYLNLEGTLENQTLQDALTAEDIMDHLDFLLYACMDARFAALYNDYKTRWVYLAMLQKFGYYVKMHPGIQHKAGVPVGGTFVMVYHERSKVTKANTGIFTKGTISEITNVKTAATLDVNLTAQKEQLINLADEKLQKAFVPGAVAAETKSAAAEPAAATAGAAPAGASASGATASGASTINTNLSSDASALNQSAQAIGATYTGIRQLDTNKLKAQLTAKQLAIIDKLFYKPIVTRHTLDELTAQLPDKIVIADFYLPYMCCSDCPPIYYIINETAPDPVIPTISLKQTQFCNDDKTAFSIDVSPTGGTITGEGVLTANGVSTFNPSSVDLSGNLSKIVSLVYNSDGQTATANVTVFAKPTADFEILDGTTYTLFVFNNLSKNASAISWDFGDGITGTGDNPSHNYAEDGPYVVTLTATNGICTNAITKPITVEKASIQLDGSPFCVADKKNYPIVVTPTGGTFTGDGVIQGESMVFSPSAVVLDPKEAFRDITIGYTLPGQYVQIIVRVYNMPSATFTVQDSAASGNIKSFITSNAFNAQYQWDFGDGNVSVEANPSHQYAGPGNYLVKLSVTNGACNDSSTQTVTIIQASVQIDPTSFCSADKTTFPIAVSPSGGKISGEGTQSSGAGFIFKPLGVSIPATAASKTITIVYQAGGQSAQTQVTVFQTPDPSFTVVAGTAAPNIYLFNPTGNGFPVTLSWDFGDGSNSNLANPTHQYTQSGSYTVTLIATNGPCSPQSSQTVNVNIVTTPTKTCGPLADIIGSFNTLSSVNHKSFDAFTTDGYKSYSQIAKFFSVFGDLSTATPDKQLAYFLQIGIDSLLKDWFTVLNPLVQKSNYRDLAIDMWRVLSDLATFIMCIQDGDYDGDKINLSAIFKLVLNFESGWKEYIKGFAATDLTQLQKLLEDMQGALNQLTSNKEADIKNNYANDLNQMIKILTGLQS